ncbi:hypothetical protein PV327_005186 [Microctonus hyperodae]|uniref:F-box domain-containing protein n=1 Tax=Microctonus hyperodae TaxID=165561 RepID=A0AA39G2A5_MICHY|nr:hypothetical protein PV327_005186 [Microctonus hyperodae]
MAEAQILNFDVLLEIFSYLKIRERLRMELVCKQWRDASQFMLGSINTMDCLVHDDDACERFVEFAEEEILYVWSNIETDLEKALKKFAHTLNKIIIMDDRRNAYMSRYFYKLLNKCTLLKYAEFECRHPRSLERFLKYLPTDNLKHLSIYFTPGSKHYRPLQDTLINEALSKAKKLKSLNLNDVPVTVLQSIGGTNTLKLLFIKIKSLPQLNFHMNTLQNLETLVIECNQFHSTAEITQLMKTCRQLHSVCIRSTNILPKTTLNEMMTLPNLQRLSLSTSSNGYESWHQFSNLVDIQISQGEPFSLTKNQILSFLQRSKNLKTYDFSIRNDNRHFNKVIREVGSHIGHECLNYYPSQWTQWRNTMFFL